MESASINPRYNPVKLGLAPNNSLRDGFTPLDLGTSKKHPVEEMQRDHLRRQEDMHMSMTVAAHGIHAGVRMKMERSILSNTQRLPGLSSSFLGLSTVMDMEDSLEFEDVLSVEVPEDPMKNKTVHELIEARMGFM